MERKIILVDENTGEKIGDYTPKRKPHYHYYLTFYSALASAKLNITFVMQIILGQMDTKNKIMLNTEKLRILSNNYGATNNAFKVAAHKMTSLGLMQRIGMGLYFANPYYFSKTNIGLVETLRKEYAEILFTTCNKAKRETPTQKESKRIRELENQIKNIIKK